MSHSIIAQLQAQLTQLAATVPDVATNPLWTEIQHNIRTLKQTWSAPDEAGKANATGSEAETRKLAEQFLLENANSIILRLDVEGRVTYLNEFAQRFFDYSPAEIIGQNAVGTIVPATNEAGENLAELIRNIVTNPNAYTNNENENMRRNGERVWVAWSNKPIFDDSGQIEEVLCVGNDVTDHRQAEMEILHQKDFLGKVIDAIPVGIFAKDVQRDFRFTVWNKKMEEIFGVERDTILGKSDYDFFDKGEADYFRQTDKLVVESGKMEDIPQEEVSTNRGPILAHTIKVPLYDNSGAPQTLLGILEDVTASIKMKATLQEKEERLAEAHQIAQLGTWSWDLAGDKVIWNERTYQIFGVPAGTEIGFDLFQSLIHPDDRNEIIATIQKTMESNNDSYEIEHRLVRANNEVRHIHSIGRIKRSSDGRPTAIVGVTQDITERKVAEQALQRAEEKYRSIFENAVEGIFQTTVDGQYISANPALAQMYGYDSPQLLIETLTNIKDQLYIDPSRRDDFIAKIGEAGQVSDFESKIYRRDGEIIWISENARSVYDKDGNVAFFEGTVTDITHRKKAEEGLLQALERTESLYRIGDAMATATDEQQVFEVILGEYLRLLHVKWGKIALLDHAEEQYKIRALYTEGQPVQTDIALSTEEALFQHLVAQPEPLIIGDVFSHPLTQDNQVMRELLQAKSMLYLPITLRGQMVGVMAAGCRHENRAFLPNVIEIGQVVVDQLAIWLENRQLLAEAQYRSARLQTAAEVSRAASSILDVDDLINASVNLIRDQFDFYYVGLFLIDEAKAWAVLHAGTGEAGRIQLEQNHRLKIGEESMIGWSVYHREARIALDVGQDAVRFKNPILPDTRSEMALPLISREEVIGALTVQSTEQGAFSKEDITLLQTMADQLANAIANAHLFERVAQARREAETRLRETMALQRLGQSLSGTLRFDEILSLFFETCIREIGFEYMMLSLVDQDRRRVNAVGGVGVSENNIKRANHPLDDKDIMADIIRTGQTEVVTGWDDRFDPVMYQSEGHAEWVRVFTPIVLRQENVGLVEAGFKRPDAAIEEPQLRLLRAFVTQTAMALDNARRYEASQQRARREALIKEITTRVRSSTDLETILQTTIKEIGDALGSRRTYIHLDYSTDHSGTPEPDSAVQD